MLRSSNLHIPTFLHPHFLTSSHPHILTSSHPHIQFSPMTPGFIGLGAMGRPMAERLMAAGHALHVYARRPETAAALIDAGATAHPTPSALAGSCDVVITMVTGTADVEEVLLGPQGVVEGARPGTVVIDMSTVSPIGTSRIAAALAARGLQMLDAPVTGGVAGAVGGTLTIMVGGESAILERVRPLLACLGTNIVYMGGSGAGQTAKGCNQLALLVTAEGVAEALALARRCGLDPASVRQALLGGIAASRVLDVFGARMIDRSLPPAFPARLYHKDLHIVFDIARGAGQELPAAAVVMQHIDTLIERDQGGQDISVLIDLLEEPSSRDDH
ncbi:MAG: NAD(P)-dependent oxidoreductase [Acidobacteriota bacterium]